MAKVYKHTNAIVFLGVETCPKMSRPKVLPVEKDHEASQTDSSAKMPRTNVLSPGKGHVASQNESGPPTMVELFRTLNQKFEVLDRLLVRTGNKINDMVKEIWNNNQRRPGLEQLQSQQSRLAMKIDVLENKKTSKREDSAPDGDLEISRLTGSMTRCV